MKPTGGCVQHLSSRDNCFILGDTETPEVLKTNGSNPKFTFTEPQDFGREICELSLKRDWADTHTPQKTRRSFLPVSLTLNCLLLSTRRVHKATHHLPLPLLPPHSQPFQRYPLTHLNNPSPRSLPWLLATPKCVYFVQCLLR